MRARDMMVPGRGSRPSIPARCDLSKWARYRLHVRAPISIAKALHDAAESEGETIARVSRRYLRRGLIADGYLGDQGIESSGVESDQETESGSGAGSDEPGE